MPGFNPDKVNIHDLTVEEPEKQSELPFDPEKDITEDDWEAMKKSLDKTISRDSRLGIGMGQQTLYEILSQAQGMCILNPEIHLEIDGSVRQVIEEKIQADRKKAIWFFRASEMKVIDPSIKYDEHPKAWKKAISDIKKAEKEGRWDNFVFLAAVMKIMHPAEEIPVASVDWGAWADYLAVLKQKSISQFIHCAARTRIIRPDLDLHLDQNDWKKMIGFLDSLRNEKKRNFFPRIAAEMKILVAEKVEVTDKGLVITMPEKKEEFSSETPQMPEQRSF